MKGHSAHESVTYHPRMHAGPLSIQTCNTVKSGESAMILLHVGLGLHVRILNNLIIYEECSK